jgi:hypothetical protein
MDKREQAIERVLKKERELRKHEAKAEFAEGLIKGKIDKLRSKGKGNDEDSDLASDEEDEYDSEEEDDEGEEGDEEGEDDYGSEGGNDNASDSN